LGKEKEKGKVQKLPRDFFREKNLPNAPQHCAGGKKKKNLKSPYLENKFLTSCQIIGGRNPKFF
jgi:hypothetical protein